MEILLPEIPEERKKELTTVFASSLIKHQDKLNFDLPNMLENEAFAAYRKERENRLEYVLRYLIPHPIKGEITKNKCKWRGLYIKERPWHMSSSEIKLDEGLPRLICRFALPIVCGKTSRSGKRKAFEIDLGFDAETMALYLAWCSKNTTFMFGGRNYGKTAARYKCRGLVEQIKKGEVHGTSTERP